MAKKKSVAEIVSEVYSELEKLQPTTDEIAEYAKLIEGVHGVVTYSKHKRGQDYGIFLRYHDTWQKKFGGRIHIDVGYTDEDEDAEPETAVTHLMLDKDYAVDFLEFIKKRRRQML
jgi:hypothetical protein